MAIGTAGLTAALAINSILNSNTSLPSRVFVTGATGGIGIVSIIILKNLGIKVTALTRSEKYIKQLKSLGVDEVMNPDELFNLTMQNLALAKWDAAIDVAGGNILSSLIKSINPGGSISITGNVQSTSFNTNVLPFILRGITLNGINAEMQEKKYLYNLINKLNEKWLPEDLNDIYTLINLDQLPTYIDSYIKGELFGRVVVKI